MSNAAARLGGTFRYGLAVGSWLSVFCAGAGAQLFDSLPTPRPPGDVPGVVPAPPPPTQSLAPPNSTGSIPRGPALQSLPPAAAPNPTVSPSVPSGQVALAVSARFGRDLPVITGGLH